MKFRRLHTLNFLLAALLTMAAGVSCVEPVSESSSRSLTVRISVPTADLVTKTSPVNAVDAENKVYEVRVWAFDCENPQDQDHAVGYGEVSIAGGSNQADIPVIFPNSVNGKLDNAASVSVDFYVVANPESVGFQYNSIDDVTRASVRDAVIQGNENAGFGTACVDAVPSTGLPMTAILSDVDITDLKDGQDHSLPNPIQLKRAVSKIRFVFAKAGNMKKETVITSIQFMTMLPPATYLFPYAVPAYTDAETITWTGTNGSLVSNDAFSGKTVDTPLRLRWDYFSANSNDENKIAAYESFLTDEIEDDHAIEKVLYLRESDKTDIVARITYQVDNGTKKSVDIPIPNPTSGTCPFQRNRWWTVYAYFMSFEMEFQVTVNPNWYGYGAVNVAG